MTWFLAWLLAVEVVGFAVLPLTVRVLRPLPDRGFLFSKPFGILLVGYICWFLGVLGAVRFQQGTIFAIVLLVGAGLWLTWGKEALKQLSGARTVIFAMELLFLVSLAASSVIRAFNPEISGTEKPMDFAFLNSVVRTDTLPPEDPWLSGSSISYYYFGYYLLGLLAKLSAVPASVGYNLSVALVFSFLLAGSYGIAFNLLSTIKPGWSLAGRLIGALLAPIVVGIMGNLEIVFEILATKGYANAWLWQLAGIKNLHPATQASPGLFPTEHWWWWRASRIIPTTQPDGINEFPYFSFLLGDLHPHFTAVPWVLLAIAASFAQMLRRAQGNGIVLEWPLRISVAMILGFLLVGNSWDFPTYTGLFWLATLVPLSTAEWNKALLVSKAKGLAVVSALSVVLYAPFFLGFSSQTKGVGLSADRTPLPSLLIIFGAVLVGLGAFLAWRGWVEEEGSHSTLARPLVTVGAVLIIASVAAGAMALLAGVLVLGIAALVRFYASEATTASTPDRARAATMFHLLLIAVGVGLIVIPEFVFLNDLFGTRMNTVFKFHYQSWILLGIASSVGVIWLAVGARRLVTRLASVVPFALLVCAGLLYPLGATASKANDFKSQQPTLDGAAFYKSLRQDDYAAIEWLDKNTSGRPVVLEATGGPYSEYARVSTFSGLPTVLGWGGHEAQWGRSGEELQRRTQDIDAVYSTGNRDSILSILRKYQVQYVFVGSLEAEKYGQSVTDRFTGLLEPAFRQGRTAVYRVPGVSGVR